MSSLCQHSISNDIRDNTMSEREISMKKMYEAKIKELEKKYQEEITKKGDMKKPRKIKTLDPVNTLTIKEIKGKKKYFQKKSPGTICCSSYSCQ